MSFLQTTNLTLYLPQMRLKCTTLVFRYVREKAPELGVVSRRRRALAWTRLYCSWCCNWTRSTATGIGSLAIKNCG
jgi:hypothetical protein